MNKIDTILDFTLNNASCNIKYRIKKEILKIPADSAEMIDLQEQITKLPKVKKAFSCQHENGFIGNVLHGVYFDGFDSTVDFLKRNGVEISNPHMQKAKECLINWQNYEQDHFYKAGNAMDEHGRGGFRAIWASVLVELGADESAAQIQEQINNALNAFRGAMNYACVDDFTKKATMKGSPCRYYIKGAAFPAANHVSILEKTISWRTEENIEMVRKSYSHCMEIMKNYNDGTIYINCGHFVGPFNHNWNPPSHIISIRDFDSHPINFAWFLKNLGSPSVKYPVFDKGNSTLKESLYGWISDGDIYSMLNKVTDEQLRLFKKYAAIEPSWRKKESILCDLYFPILMSLAKN